MKNDHVTQPSRRALLRRPHLLTAVISCGLSLAVACSDDEGNDVPVNTAGSGGTAGAAGAAGRAGASGNAGAPNDAGAGPAAGPRGTVTVLSEDADGLQSPTTAAVRDTDLWVVNGQLGALFNPAATTNLPFNLVSVPLAGGAIGATDIELPGDDFFPEGIAAAADGTLYVGSVALGSVVRIPAGSTTPDADEFVEAGVAERGVVGLTVDEARDTLWFCDSGPTAPVQGGAIVGVDLETGVETVRHAMPNPGSGAGGVGDAGAPDAGAADAGASDAGVGDAGAAPAAPTTFCNDLIVVDGDIFATDTGGGRVFRVPSADVDVDDSAEVWLENPAIAGGFAPNGIDQVGDNLVIATNGTLVLVDPDSNNPASAVEQVSIVENGAAGALCGPDGLQTVPGSDDEVVVIENGFCPAGLERVVKVTLSDL